MTKQLTRLTDAQKARMESFAQEWIQYGWRTQPLTEEEWAVWEAGARRCYEFAGLPWPGTVIRVGSPIVGAFAAPLAAYAIEKLRGAAGSSAVGSAVYSAVDSAVGSAVDSAVYSAVGSAVYSAVDSAVGSAVYSAVGSAVYSAVYSAVDSAVYSAVDSAVYSAVDSAVDSAVYSAVDSAVDSADPEARTALRRLTFGAGWWRRLGGRHWAWRNAFIDYFRDVAELQLDGDLWDRSRAYDDAMSAGWWFPFKDFVMVCDVPITLHLEASGQGPNGYRLHCESGPAIAWADGWGLHSWHGVGVPADLVEGDGWDVERILREDNAEVRRCAIERQGWDWFVTAAGLTQVGATVDDPGNPGHELALYDLPEQIFDEPVRVLLCHNATPERDGTRRRFGLTVPGSISDPIAAAGWTFGLNPSEYAALERAS